MKDEMLEAKRAERGMRRAYELADELFDRLASEGLWDDAKKVADARTEIASAFATDVICAKTVHAQKAHELLEDLGDWDARIAAVSIRANLEVANESLGRLLEALDEAL